MSTVIYRVNEQVYHIDLTVGPWCVSRKRAPRVRKKEGEKKGKRVRDSPRGLETTTDSVYVYRVLFIGVRFW